jgi:MFS family permease
VKAAGRGRSSAFALLLAGSAVLALNAGIRQSLGLFIAPMMAQLHWDRGVFATALGLQNLLWGLSGPLLGMLADRIGTRPVVALGGVFFAGGLALMAFGHSPLLFTLGAGLLLGIAVGGTSFAIVLGAVSKSVAPEQRSVALGIVSAGGSLGQFAAPILSQVAIGTAGWSGSLLWMALFAALAIPLAFWIRTPQHLTAATDLDTQSLAGALREASGVPSFWFLNAGFFVCGFHVAFISTHLPLQIASAALAPIVSAIALALIGAFNFIASYGVGYLGGIYPKRYLLTAIYGLRAVVFLVFLAVPMTVLSVYVFAAAIGLLWLGTVPLTSGLVSVIFGTRWSATLLALLFLSHQIGAFLGAWLGGVVYNVTGSYNAMWLACVGLAVFAALVNLPIVERPVLRLHGQSIPAA